MIVAVSATSIDKGDSLLQTRISFAPKRRSVAVFRLLISAIVVLMWSTPSGVSAAPCGRTSVEQDRWVGESVNALVRAARVAYENDDRRKPYERVVDSIAATMNQCRLADNRDFVKRYPEFVGYVNLLALARRNDH